MSVASLPTFEDLYAQYQAPLYRRLVGLVGPEQAEDVLQETFVRVWRAYPPATTEHLSSWLYTIATNTAINALRKRQAEQRALARALAHRPVTESDEAALLERQMRQEVLASLPARHRELLSALAYGYSYGELATHYALTLAQLTQRVKTARLMARGRYRQAIGEQGARRGTA